MTPGALDVCGLLFRFFGANEGVGALVLLRPEVRYASRVPASPAASMLGSANSRGAGDGRVRVRLVETRGKVEGLASPDSPATVLFDGWTEDFEPEALGEPLIQ